MNYPSFYSLRSNFISSFYCWLGERADARGDTSVFLEIWWSAPCQVDDWCKHSGESVLSIRGGEGDEEDAHTST